LVAVLREILPPQIASVAEQPQLVQDARLTGQITSQTRPSKSHSP
jgi:hypothetical protein